MRFSRIYIRAMLLAFGTFSLPFLSAGQGAPGVTEKEILIGSCAALEGPSSFLGKETVAGAEAYFQSVNEEGGINGRKLRLVSLGRWLRSREDAGVLGQIDGAKGIRHGIFCRYPDGGEICAAGGEQQSAVDRALHRRANALHSVAPLGGQRASFVWR